MAPSKFRKAIGAVKDQTSIGLAKVGNTACLADLDVAIVKATRHEEEPPEEKHLREVISLTSYSHSYVSACVSMLARRLNKTRNWTVALKTLMLIQRLLGEGDPTYEQEIFFATRRGTRLLNMTDFRDATQSGSWDYSAFVRTYALYLDERLEYRMLGRRGRRSAFGYEEEEEAAAAAGGPCGVVSKATPVNDMKIDQVFSRIHHFQQLLERFLACRPTGAAKNNRVVMVALYPIVKESFQMYYDTTEVLGILIDRFMDLDVADCVKVYEIFCRTGKQFDELELFYVWCRDIGIARTSEYPEVEKITHKKLEVMDEFIRDKSAYNNRKQLQQQGQETQQVQHNPPEETTKDTPEDINSVKALPPPESYSEEEEEEEVERAIVPAPAEDQNKKQEEGDLLNLADDVTTEEQGDKLALALFGEGSGPGPATKPAWEAFEAGGGADWETALAESASHLSGNQSTLAGGFDMMLLDGMYQRQGAHLAGAAAADVNGSASSVALGSSGRPAAMLALPAPPAPGALEGTNTAAPGGDPFAASLAVAPPPYVQMSEMEKKQRLLVEEQLMWQKYARDGMNGQLGITNFPQQNPYNMGH